MYREVFFVLKCLLPLTLVTVFSVNAFCSEKYEERNSKYSEQELYSLENARIQIKYHGEIDRTQLLIEDLVQPYALNSFVGPLLANIGEKVWTLITGNERPHGVDWTKIKAHALPLGVNAPIELPSWNEDTKCEGFEILIENVLGIDLFRMETELSYNYGAPYRGNGKHIANVTVIAKDASAFIGFKGNSEVRVLDPFYDSNRVAILPIVIETKVSGPFDTIVRSQRYDLRGDGKSLRSE